MRIGGRRGLTAFSSRQGDSRVAVRAKQLVRQGAVYPVSAAGFLAGIQADTSSNWLLYNSA